MWTVDARALSSARESRGLTVAQLASKSGIDERTLRRWARADGPARLVALSCAAKALGVDVTAIARSSPNAPRAAPAQPARSRPASTLEQRVAMERHVGRAAPLDTPDGAIPALGAREMQCVFSAYRAYEGARFHVRGWRVERHRGLSREEARALSIGQGVGAYFELVREIARGADLRVTVHATDAKTTRALHARLFEEVPMVVRVVAAGDDEAVFQSFQRERAGPWALVVEKIVEGGKRAG